MEFEDIVEIAKACHNVNKEYCESIGDTSQVPWDDAEEWQRDSAVDGVKFYLDNPGVTPEMQHESWLKMKVEGGWVYGEVKSAELKTHPCITSYNNLSDEEKMKDRLFRMMCKYKIIEIENRKRNYYD